MYNNYNSGIHMGLAGSVYTNPHMNALVLTRPIATCTLHYKHYIINKILY